MDEILDKKLNPGKYILALVLITLLIIAASIFIMVTQEQKPNPASEKVIREAVARQLNKDPNYLTDEDFARIIELSVSNNELSDIKLLEKFSNLQELTLEELWYPKSAIPKWMKILIRFRIVNPDDRFAIDLSPLKKLQHLHKLNLRRSTFKNIEPLSSLINMEELNLSNTQVSDIQPLKNRTNLTYIDISFTHVSNLEPIKKLTNLKTLRLQDTQVSDLEPIKDLTKLESLFINGNKISDLKHIKKLINLKKLMLTRTNVSDLKPIKYLIDLQELHLNETKIYSLKPLKSLPKLNLIYIKDCTNITEQEIEDLQKAMPSLKIER